MNAKSPIPNMTLLWSSRSPFAMKVAIAVDLLELGEHVARRKTIVAMTQPPSEDILASNPLGKIPTLLVDDERPLAGSSVIIEYLDRLTGGGRLIPQSGPEWISSRRREALADGLIDILVLWRTEVGRDANTDERIIMGFELKAKSTLLALESEASDFSTEHFDIGQISCVCMLAYLDFRYPACDWRDAAPCLAAWYSSMRKRDAVARNQFKISEGGSSVNVAFSFNEVVR